MEAPRPERRFGAGNILVISRAMNIVWQRRRGKASPCSIAQKATCAGRAASN